MKLSPELLSLIDQIEEGCRIKIQLTRNHKDLKEGSEGYLINPFFTESGELIEFSINWENYMEVPYLIDSKHPDQSILNFLKIA